MKPYLIYLNVPYAQKDEVKKRGARWDNESRGWYVTERTPLELFTEWLPRMFNPNARPPYIVADLVPQPCWGLNLRSFLPTETWNELRTECYELAGRRCEVCGGRGAEWPVECNEQWHYLESPSTPGRGIQKLLRLTALCPPCHWIKHLGKAQLQGNFDAALNQLSYVNGWTVEECDAHAAQAFYNWERRSAIEWTTDISILSKWGVSEITLNGYNFDEIPLVQGVEVIYLPTCADIFNASAASN